MPGRVLVLVACCDGQSIDDLLLALAHFLHRLVDLAAQPRRLFGKAVACIHQRGKVADPGLELQRIDRLCEEIDGTCVQGLHARRRVEIGSHDHEGLVAVSVDLGELTEQLDARISASM
jgi:hypothetical protein